MVYYDSYYVRYRYNTHGFDENLKKIEARAVKRKDVAMCKLLCELKGFDAEAMSKVILEKGTAKDSAFFINKSLVDIDAHEKKIIKENDAQLSFVCLLRSSRHTEEHRNIILQSKNPSINFKMMLLSPCELREKHINAILKSNDAEYIYRVSKYIPERFGEIQEALIKSKNAEYCLKFAENCKDADIARIEKIVLMYGNELQSSNFCKSFTPQYLNEHVAKICQSSSYHLILRCVEEFEGDQKQKFIDTILKSRNAKYIYLLAKKTNPSNIVNYIKAVKLKNYSDLNYYDLLKDLARNIENSKGNNIIK